jgi:hypothetical protein
MKNYVLPKEGLEVLLLALQIFEKQGSKYPSIVTEEHFAIAQKMTRELLVMTTTLTEGRENDTNENGITNSREIPEGS